MQTHQMAGELPERGYGFLAGEVRRGRTFPREEVAAALVRYQEAAADAVATGDWNRWADLFTEDAIYVEHQYGVIRGREAIRRWITRAMQGQALELEFPVEWSLIDNDLVFIYCPIGYPARDGEARFQFVSATVLCYGGDGRWCYEEDIYNADESLRIHAAYAATKGGAD
jgi:uncharacterized protein (TIGR02246 family)